MPPFLHWTSRVLHHWAWVIYIAGLTLLGTFLVLTARIRPGQPDSANRGPRRRLRLGFAAFALVAGILIFAPTVAFGWIFGWDAVLAYWASVCALVVLTIIGFVLVFTDKGRVRQNS